MSTEHKEPIADISAGLSCPMPISDYKQVLLAHGGGGKLSQQLLEKFFFPQLGNEFLAQQHDGAMLSIGGNRLAFSTDSYVVNPIFFPGGTIGDLAVNGTVNDLSMCGAEPKYLSCGFIIEEGLPMEDLWRVILSMKEAAEKAGVLIVTGDTKVVDRGKGDKLYINTAGIGFIPEGIELLPKNVQPGDVVILSGDIASHGIAIMSVREGLELDSPIVSDSAPLNGLVRSMLNVCKNIRVMRDATRGGVASALNEIASAARIGIVIDQKKIPISDDVKGACEILGFDPLYVANEGRLVAFVPPQEAEQVLGAMRDHPLGVRADIIGTVTADHPGVVLMRSTIGGTRVVDMLSGEQLPRIC